MWNVQKVVSKGDYNYAVVPEHPSATKNGYVLEHRIVVENHLGRLLDTNEVVHHINGDKKDNRIENLLVIDRQKHSHLHGIERGVQMVLLQCPWCGTVFTRPKRQSFLSKPNKYHCTCCSPSCRGKMSRHIQLHGLTAKLKKAISENLLAEYLVKSIDEDNSEETAHNGIRRDYTPST